MGYPLSTAPRSQQFTRRAPISKATPIATPPQRAPETARPAAAGVPRAMVAPGPVAAPALRQGLGPTWITQAVAARYGKQPAAVHPAAPMSNASRALASHGQGSDRHLVHVNDRELEGLKRMTPSGGGPNPITGLPQFDGAPAPTTTAASPANPWAIFGSTQSPYDLTGGVPGQGSSVSTSGMQGGGTSTSGMQNGIAGLGNDPVGNLVRAELGGGSISTVDQLAQQAGLGKTGSDGTWQPAGNVGAGYTTSTGTGTNLGGAKSLLGDDKGGTTGSGLTMSDVQSAIQAALQAQFPNQNSLSANVTNVPVTNPDGSVTTTQGPGQTAAQVLSQLTPNRTNRFASDYFAPNFAA